LDRTGIGRIAGELLAMRRKILTALVGGAIAMGCAYPSFENVGEKTSSAGTTSGGKSSSGGT
jgi:hypothetical protein